MSWKVAEAVANLWLFGIPLLLLSTMILKALQSISARLRYLIAVSGFGVSFVLPLWASASGKSPLHLAWPTFGNDTALSSGAGSMAFATSSSAFSEFSDVSGPWIQSSVLGFALVWAVGVGLLLAREACGFVLLRHYRREWLPAPTAIARELGWPTAVPLHLHPSAQPATVGLLCPNVVLPANILSLFPLDVARSIARHELAHMRWRDPAVHSVLRMCALVAWPSPLWLHLRLVRRERELSADEAAIGAVDGGPARYVAALLDLGKGQASRFPTMELSMAASEVEFRARWILAADRGARSSYPALAGAVVVLLAMTRLSPVSFQAAEASAAAIVPSRSLATVASTGDSDQDRVQENPQRQLPRMPITSLPQRQPLPRSGLELDEVPVQPSSDFPAEMESMIRGAAVMDSEARGMEIEARRLRTDEPYRKRLIAEQAARGRELTEAQLIEMAEGLESGAAGLVSGARGMRDHMVNLGLPHPR